MNKIWPSLEPGPFLVLSMLLVPTIIKKCPSTTDIHQVWGMQQMVLQLVQPIKGIVAVVTDISCQKVVDVRRQANTP